jgi:hypothetical protein
MPEKGSTRLAGAPGFELADVKSLTGLLYRISEMGLKNREMNPGNPK